jgi:hypothetical protein
MTHSQEKATATEHLELGQILFASNTQEIERPHFMAAKLSELGDHIARHRGDRMSLLDNSGEEEFKNGVFAMRCYCWCDGAREGHEGGCPPNFEHFQSGLSMSWYKHAGRGATVNRIPSATEWNAIVAECRGSI